MITKNSTKKGYQFAYLIVIPVLIMALFAFSHAPVQQSESPSKTEGYIPDMKPLAEKDIVRVSSGWGMRKHPITKEMKMHSAVDFVAQIGTPVLATANGKVIRISFKEKGKGYGRYVVVSHGKTYATLYSQLSEFKVETGQMLKKGDIVGLVGSSGISTGPHLHYEVRKHGKAVNPADYFNKK